MPGTLNILCGKIGSGKSTLAAKMAHDGSTVMSLDDKVFQRTQHLRDPQNDYRLDEATLRRTEDEVSRENLAAATQMLRDGKSVVFDYGFWKKGARDAFRKVPEELGAEFVLYYLQVSDAEQSARVDARNNGDLTSVHFISKEELVLFNQRFEPPSGEGEIVVDSNGNKQHR